MTIQADRTNTRSPETRRVVRVLNEAERRIKAFGRLDNNEHYQRGLAAARLALCEVRDQEQQR